MQLLRGRFRGNNSKMQKSNLIHHKMETFGNDADQGFMKELECPVCMEYMLPPITFCENGHNICNSCKLKLNKCPTCRKHFLNARNFALENIARQTKYPCTYHKFGCSETYSMDFVMAHQNECIYGPHRCPFSREACIWIGSIPDMKTHIKNNHSDRIYRPDPQTGVLSIRLLNVRPTMKYNSIIIIEDEVFFRRYELKDNCFYVVLQYLGSKKDATRFKYRFSVSTSDDTRRIDITEVTRSIVEDLDKIYNSKNCVIVLFEAINKFFHGTNNLETEVFVSSVS